MTDRRRPFSPITEVVSHDTVDALRRLLDDAERGEVIGLAYAVMYKRRTYMVDAAGEAYRNPTFALGMTHVLSSVLERRALGMEPEE